MDIIKNFQILKKEISNWVKNPYFGFVKGHDYLEEKQLHEIKSFVGENNYEVIRKFEKKFAKSIGLGNAISYASARMGFYSLLDYLKIGEGDEVILTGFTCAVMSNAVWKVGAKPVFTDIDPSNFGTCSIAIKDNITPKTKMIVAQHTFGIPCNIDKLVNIAKENNIFILEDCALTHGSSSYGKKIGSFGDASLFSTDHSKPINSFMGGLIYTESEEIHYELSINHKSIPHLSIQHQKKIWNKLLYERKYFQPTRYGKNGLISILKKNILFEKNIYLDGDFEKESNHHYPYPASMPSFIAALGLIEMDRWNNEIVKRRKTLDDYLMVANVCGLNEFLPYAYFDKDLDIVPLRFIYQHPLPNKIKERMSDFIDVDWFWFNQPLIGCKNINAHGYIKGSCIESEKASKNIINWPCIFSAKSNVYLFENLKDIYLNYW